MLKEAIELEPGLRHDLNMSKAWRDALQGINAPADWTRDQEEADQLRAQDAQKQQIAEAIAAVQGGAAAGIDAGKAAQELQVAGIMPGMPG